ncbi:MAG: MurR/RpiR family transcriptional regulator [Lachnospiraceae bacterium]|nr:MurR/RpiR family transcriptional regulator [Lachnospiraceae bacterium]
MIDNMIAVINEKQLTKTQKWIADFVLDHESEACFMTSAQIASKLDISEASVARFCQALGFKGYAQFQSALQSDFQKRISEITQTVTVPAEKIRLQEQKSGRGDLWYSLYDEAIGNLGGTYTANSAASIKEAASIIVKSRKKYIASTRGNTNLGDYFHLYLKHLVPNVENTTSVSASAVDHMCNISDKDCLILFSFPRYSSVGRITAQMASDAGAPIIVLTDKRSSDMARFADVLLTAPIEISTFFNSMVGPQFLTEALLAEISTRVKGVEERLRRIDKYLDQLGNY